MKVELISVGTEILLGNIVNTNAAYLSERCAALGLSCYYQSVVGDNEERLKEVLENARKRADVILLSGGLGPTADDLTKETVAKVLKRTLFMDENSRKQIEIFFRKRDMVPTDNNWKQAMVPEGAIVVKNENGTAPGMILTDNKTHIILLPGPPNELVPMFEKDIAPYLDKLEPGTIYSKTVKICGIGESSAETMISHMIEEQDNPTIAPYAKMGEVHFRVTAKAETQKAARKKVKPVVKILKNVFGKNIYTTKEDVTLEKAVVDMLLTHKLQIVTAESCTGGMLSARLTNVAGISAVFKAGYITYSNKAKRKLIGVNKSILDKYGAVSEAVAKDMAKGAAVTVNADVSVAITGIAGPDGGSEKKPVGLVYIACSVCGILTVKKYYFSGNRSKIRESAVSAALTQLRTCILDYYSGNSNK